MELIRGLHNIRSRHKGCVLTIGNFDGVHLGHQELLRQLTEQGRRQKLPVMVMIFEPQPLELFSPEQAPTRITRLRDKCKYLAQCGIDYLLCVKFDRDFASMTADEFISLLLLEQLEVARVIVGDDFRFGRWRAGDIQLLKQAGQQFRFQADSVESFISQHGVRVSSTAIRQALHTGNLSDAALLLGRHYSISGRVVHGDAIGRTLGFPTANIALDRFKAPMRGVYAVDVYGYGDHVLHGVANIGTRPTVAGRRQLLEVHLLDFNQNLYAQHIEVVIQEKLRDEQRFASLDALKAQIDNDVLQARQFFAVPLRKESQGASEKCKSFHTG